MVEPLKLPLKSREPGGQKVHFPVEQELFEGQRPGEVRFLHVGFQFWGTAAPAEEEPHYFAPIRQ